MKVLLNKPEYISKLSAVGTVVWCQECKSQLEVENDNELEAIGREHWVVVCPVCKAKAPLTLDDIKDQIERVKRAAK